MGGLVEMSRRKRNEEMDECPVCSAKVRASKLAGHMRNVHGDTSHSADAGRSVAPHKGRRSERRKAALARRRQNRAMAAAACIMVVLAIALAISQLRNDAGSAGPAPLQGPPPQSETTVTIATSGLSTSAKFYGYNSYGVNMRYFAVLGAGGEVHVALDACDVCYAEKKGYRQVGDVMKCNNCGKEFAIGSIGTENMAGGCWPSYVPVALSGGDALMQLSDLDAKSYMFR